MILNTIERLYVNSPVHTVAQIRNVNFLRRIHALAPGSRVVEIGCGRGVGMRLILDTFDPGLADALDIDPKMVALTKRRLRTFSAERVSARLADAHTLPYESSSIDAVFDFGVLHHLEQWTVGLSEIARVLRPGAHFYIEEYFPALYANAFFGKLLRHPEENRFSAGEFRDALDAAGLMLLPGYAESKFRLLGVAVREG